LLTPGVVTRSILDQYINMLKILQVIDPTGQVYEQITNPIKTYLLKRTDTLRCIITLLM
jgi:anaphase-promoting complex subunit 2